MELDLRGLSCLNRHRLSRRLDVARIGFFCDGVADSRRQPGHRNLTIAVRGLGYGLASSIVLEIKRPSFPTDTAVRDRFYQSQTPGICPIQLDIRPGIVRTAGGEHCLIGAVFPHTWIAGAHKHLIRGSSDDRSFDTPCGAGGYRDIQGVSGFGKCNTRSREVIVAKNPILIPQASLIATRGGVQRQIDGSRPAIGTSRKAGNRPVRDSAGNRGQNAIIARLIGGAQHGVDLTEQPIV